MLWQLVTWQEFKAGIQIIVHDPNFTGVAPKPARPPESSIPGEEEPISEPEMQFHAHYITLTWQKILLGG